MKLGIHVRDHDLRTRERGRAYVLRERTWAEVAQRTEQLIAEALVERSKAN